jgi:hypothetical protein
MLDASRQRIPGSADEFADSVAAIANQVFAFETTLLGYQAPPTDGMSGGGPEYDIYIEEMGNTYGETMPEVQLDTRSDGGRFTTYMRVDNDFIFVNPVANRGLPGLRVTLAHEYHHAIQIGSYGYWTGDVYFYEITCTWMEDVLFPEVNDYLIYLRASWGHFRNPDKPFTSNETIMYSRGLWGHYIAAAFGPEVIRAAWQAIPNARPLAAMDQALRAVGSTFKIAFAEWVKWNYYTGSRCDSATYYPEGRLYPTIVESPMDFVPPSGTLTGDLQPLAARYHQVFAAGDTVRLIQANINFDAARQGSSMFFPYTVNLSSSPVDDSYEKATGSLFFRSNVADPANWKTWKVVSGIPSLSGIREGIAFPNPFRPPDPRSPTVNIAAQATRGTLYIYSSSMELVYQAAQVPDSRGFGKPVFKWNGQTHDGAPARTGVYLFVLALPDRTLSGKIALIRN